MPQHDLSKDPIEMDVKQKLNDTYGSFSMKENIVGDSCETVCMLNSKARTL